MNESNDKNLKMEGDAAAPDFGRLAKVAAEISALGHDAKTSARWARLLGDQPVRDQDDNVVVMDENKNVLARLKLKSFEE